jgi:hypothetical protein
MDIFNEEFINFWKNLNECHVRYIMVGGVATNLHGYQRTTDDIDVWIDDTPENRQRLRTAMLNYTGIDYFMLESMQIIPGWTSFNLNNGVRLDFMLTVKGLEGFSFEACLNLAAVADIDDVQVPFLHLNHLIAAKKAANRPKDQLDVMYLEKIQKILEEQEKRKG